MKLQIFAALVLVSGCATAPIVSDYNGASVKIRTDMMTANAGPATKAEASRICGASGKRAEYASTRQLDNYDYEHLYLCL
ncbi:MAG: hypothetical protein ACOH2H_14225 [Cypionkella sp.]